MRPGEETRFSKRPEAHFSLPVLLQKRRSRPSLPALSLLTGVKAGRGLDPSLPRKRGQQVAAAARLS
jgi:hypothetical protein